MNAIILAGLLAVLTAGQLSRTRLARGQTVVLSTLLLCELVFLVILLFNSSTADGVLVWLLLGALALANALLAMYGIFGRKSSRQTVPPD